MKIKTTKYIFGLFVIIFALTSCDKEEVTFNKVIKSNEELGFEVRDGYLVFKNNESFLKTVNSIANLSNKERENWEKGIGFISQKRLINNLIDKELALDSINQIKFADGDISKATKYDYRPELFYDLLTKNVIKIIDKGTPSEYWDYKVFNKGFTSFIDENGLYAIGDTLFQVTDKSLISINSKNISSKAKLLSLLENKRNSISKIQKVPGNSPGLIDTLWNSNNKWPKSSQRIKIQIELTFLSFTSYTARYDFKYYYYVHCQKTNFWNNWVYDGANYTVNGSWAISVYRFPQVYSNSFSYTGSAAGACINPETGLREVAGSSLWVLPNEENQSYPWEFQAAYQPIFDNYSWKVKRNDTQQVSSLTYY